jgi:hypothetical protein
VTGTLQGDSVPVTAKLSRKFYEKLGDDVANELVEWFNLVDATYRSGLRELNELNFARFRAEMDAGFARADAKLEQRVAELRAEMQTGFARFEAKFAGLEAKFAGLRAELDARFESFAARVDRRVAEMETRLTKRMFGFWIAQAATTAALVLGVVKLVH